MKPKNICSSIWFFFLMEIWNAVVGGKFQIRDWKKSASAICFVQSLLSCGNWFLDQKQFGDPKFDSRDTNINSGVPQIDLGVPKIDFQDSEINFGDPKIISGDPKLIILQPSASGFSLIFLIDVDWLSIDIHRFSMFFSIDLCRFSMSVYRFSLAFNDLL